MLFAPTIADELDPPDNILTMQRYISRYIDLCHQLGFKSYSLCDEEIRNIDYQIAQAAKKRGLSDDDIELTIWHGSQIARRLDDSDRDIYAQSFIVKVFEDEEPCHESTVDLFENYSVHYGIS